MSDTIVPKVATIEPSDHAGVDQRLDGGSKWWAIARSAALMSRASASLRRSSTTVLTSYVWTGGLTLIAVAGYSLRLSRRRGGAIETSRPG